MTTKASSQTHTAAPFGKFLIRSKLGRTWPLHLMLLGPVVLLAIFRYLPMVGISIAFQDFYPRRGFFGSDFVGLEHFRTVFNMPGMMQILYNTLFMSVGKILFTLFASVICALLANEVRVRLFKRTIETVLLFPYFISWVILAGIFVDVFALTGGINMFLGLFGLEPIFFLGTPWMFPWLIIFTHVWREMGYSMVIYTAAITSIDPALYEAASIDGANKWQQALRVTLPSIMPMVMLMTILSLGGILNAGFDQVYNMYNPMVYSTGEIIDTFVYMMGIRQAQYSMATVVGLFKSVVSCVLILLSYKLADKVAGYRVL